MAVFKCKMCGGNLEITDGMTVCECEYCGTTQTLPRLDDEKKNNMFTRANRLRYNSDFDEAMNVFGNIVAEFPEEAEAYWGLCLCRYGIEYVDDPATSKKIPTCHRTSYDSIFDDDNFKLACECADAAARRVYREEAKEIDRLQQKILDIAKNESPYDIFICYKETAEDGQRTKDSVLAQDMYDALTDKGYKVFFARITLEDKLGQEYEPYIFSALSSAKIMLAIGTDYEYFNAVWVKNEWSRFLDMMKKDKSKVLIPCYADIDAYDMPKEFKNLQGQDMGKVGFMQDLVRGVSKLIKNDSSTNVDANMSVQSVSNATTESLLKRVLLFLNEGNWQNVNEYCERILDIEPECAEAYFYKLLSDLNIQGYPNIFYLKTRKDCYSNNNFNYALRFSNGGFHSQLELIEQHFIKANNSLTCEISEGSTEIGEYAFTCFDKLTSIVIPEGIVNIGYCAFYNCSSITDVLIPDSVGYINQWAFGNCTSLAELTLPENIVVEQYAFLGCSSLSVLNIPDNFTIKQDAFSCCNIQKIVFHSDAARKKFAEQLEFVGLNRDIFLTTDEEKAAMNEEGRKNYEIAEKLAGQGEYYKAAQIFKMNSFYKDSESRYREQWRKLIDLNKNEGSVTCDNGITVGLKSDGTVVYCRTSCDIDDCKVSEKWTKITSIGVWNSCISGLTAGGTLKKSEYCYGEEPCSDVISISSKGSMYLRADHTAGGREHISGWRDIVSVNGDGNLTAIRSNGTVVATTRSKSWSDIYSNEFGQLNVSDWKNIAYITSSIRHTVGLRTDGTVVAVGDNEYGQCNVSSWTDIVSIAVGHDYTAGLRSNGTVVAVGNDENQKCSVSRMTDIAAIVCYGSSGVVGLKNDGTVVWHNADSFPPDWTDIVYITCSHNHIVGLKADGTAVSIGANAKYVLDKIRQPSECLITHWKNLKIFLSENDIKKYEEKKIAWQEEERTEKRIGTLYEEKSRLEKELEDLTGLFSIGRKKEVEKQISGINREINSLRTFINK